MYSRPYGSLCRVPSVYLNRYLINSMLYTCPKQNCDAVNLLKRRAYAYRRTDRIISITYTVVSASTLRYLIAHLTHLNCFSLASQPRGGHIYVLLCMCIAEGRANPQDHGESSGGPASSPVATPQLVACHQIDDALPNRVQVEVQLQLQQSSSNTKKSSQAFHRLCVHVTASTCLWPAESSPKLRVCKFDMASTSSLSLSTTSDRNSLPWRVQTV